MGQVKDALQELQKSPYPSQEGLASDKKYFLKKMGWSEKDLCDYLSRPEIQHDAYPSDRALWDWVRRTYNNRLQKLQAKQARD